MSDKPFALQKGDVGSDKVAVWSANARRRGTKVQTGSFDVVSHGGKRGQFRQLVAYKIITAVV